MNVDVPSLRTRTSVDGHRMIAAEKQMFCFGDYLFILTAIERASIVDVDRPL